MTKALTKTAGAAFSLRAAFKMKWIFLSILLIAPESFAKTAYVDMALAVKSTREGARVTSRLEKELANARKSTKAIENQLKKEKEKLDKDMPLLSEQKRAERIQLFQKKVLESQQQVEEKKAALQQKEEALMSPVVEKLKKIIAETAAKEGYTVVLAKTKDTLWVSPSIDITKKVSARFNKKK